MEDALKYSRAAIASGAGHLLQNGKSRPGLCRWSKPWFYLNPESNLVKAVTQEKEKIPVERTDDFADFTIVENNPHLNQPNAIRKETLLWQR